MKLLCSLKDVAVELLGDQGDKPCTSFNHTSISHQLWRTDGICEIPADEDTLCIKIIQPHSHVSLCVEILKPLTSSL